MGPDILVANGAKPMNRQENGILHIRNAEIGFRSTADVLPGTLPSPPTLGQPLPLVSRPFRADLTNSNIQSRNAAESLQEDKEEGIILSPKPQRDTLASVVDQYRDEPEYSEDEEDDLTHDGDTDRYSEDLESRNDTSEYGGEYGRRYSGLTNDSLEPREPIFDLTPTREPSPATYAYGRALEFGKLFLRCFIPY